MNLYYVANARMPTEKAHGIQIAKMCEALIEAGVTLTLVVPRRATHRRSIRDFYGLRVDIPVVTLPALDWYGTRAGYLLSSVSFICSYLLFLFRKKRAGESFILYTVDLDTFSAAPLALVGAPLFVEVHHARAASWSERLLFNRAKGIFAINRIIVEELQRHFPRASARYLVEPNGVDLESFTGKERTAARAALGLPQEVPIVLYSGQFFAWKGLEILPKAAAQTPMVRWQLVGGDQTAFRNLVEETIPENMYFSGSRPFTEMPLWYAAADAFIVLGTRRDQQSYRYTSPMKLFESFAAKRPIIASRTPALLEIVSDAEVLFYEPDSATDLARAVTSVITHPSDRAPQIAAAYRRAEASSWRARAGHIVKCMTDEVSSPKPSSPQ